MNGNWLHEIWPPGLLVINPRNVRFRQRFLLARTKKDSYHEINCCYKGKRKLQFAMGLEHRISRGLDLPFIRKWDNFLYYLKSVCLPVCILNNKIRTLPHSFYVSGREHITYISINIKNNIQYRVSIAL